MSNKKLITAAASLLIVISLLAFSVGGAYGVLIKKVYPIKYEEYVCKYSREYRVDPALVYAIIKSESGFLESAESKAGAIGLMQVMPATFKWLQSKRNQPAISYLDLADPDVNIDNGTYLMSLLLERYKSEQVALCAYNAGIGVVDSWLLNEYYSDNGVTLKYIPYRETRLYVKKVMKTKDMYNKIYFKER